MLDAAPYAVCIVNFHSYAELHGCLLSVSSQSSPAELVCVFDCESEPAELERLRRQHPDVIWKPGPNLGFAGAANALLDLVSARAPDLPFVLILNPDVSLEPAFAEQLTAGMQSQPEAAIGTGKLLRPRLSPDLGPDSRPDGEVIDSAGIRLPRHRRPRDRGSEQVDVGQYDCSEFVFGASGAAMLIRRSALADLALEGEVFDEDFFVYHEDTDLCWRANLLGWRVLYVAAARATHVRRWRRADRFEMPVLLRRYSFRNHYLQLIKNERARDFLTNLPVLAFWEAIRFAFALLRDPAVLPAYRDAWRLSGRAWRKRRLLQQRVQTPRRTGSSSSC